MKKRGTGTAILAVVLMLALMLQGCGQGSGAAEQKEALDQSADPQEVLKEAGELYDGEEKVGAQYESTYTYSDGTEEVMSSTTVSDTKNNIEYTSYTDTDGTSSEMFTVKDKDVYYTYTLDPADSKKWIRFQVDEESARIQEEAKEKGSFSYADDFFVNLQFSNEGEEKADDVDAIKIKVEYEQDYGVDEDEQEDEYTRESVMSEYGWSQEAVDAVDGFSELLDKYIEVSNNETSFANPTVVDYIWVDKNTHYPIKVESTTDLGNDEQNASQQVIDEFFDKMWEPTFIQSDLDNGMTVDESKEAIDAQRDEIVASMEEDKAQFEEEMQEEPSQLTYTSSAVYLYGDDCPKMSDLPKEYEEISSDEYYDRLTNNLE